MGCHKNIGINKFPRQGSFLYNKVDVCFNFDTSKSLSGTIVRDDSEDPFDTIIKLEDGRYVRASECQYHVVYEEEDE